jgi:hypothetical protein
MRLIRSGGLVKRYTLLMTNDQGCRTNFIAGTANLRFQFGCFFHAQFSLRQSIEDAVYPRPIGTPNGAMSPPWRDSF